MTENKPIIIHGVDVSGCEAYKDEHCKDKTSIMFCNTNLCSNFPNCYFKQLARKTQECEELKEVNKELQYQLRCTTGREKEYRTNSAFWEKHCDELKEQLDQFKAEKAKLEVQIEEDTQYHLKEEYNLRNIIRNKEKRNAELYKENNQLKAEVKSKTEYIQEQREIIDQYSKEIEIYKKCQGKRASKREDQLKAENERYKEEIMLLRKGYDEEDCTKTCPNMQIYERELKQAEQKLEQIRQIVNKLSLSINWNINKNAYEKLQSIIQIIDEVE